MTTQLPLFVIEAQQEAAACPPIVKAVRCHCGAPATWQVSFRDYPNEEYFCGAHLDPNYIADPIIWPANICTICENDHPTQRCPANRAALFAPERFACFDCGDPIDHDGICAACQEWTAHEQVTAQRQYISDELRARIRADVKERVVIDGVAVPF